MSSDRLELLNRVINDMLPEWPGLAPGFSRVDMTAFFERPGNIMLGDADGIALFGLVAPGVYEGHYLFPGRASIDKCRKFLSTVFDSHYADAILGHVPVENRPARAMTRALGFTRQGTSVSLSGRSCVDYVLERHSWVKFLEASLAA